MQPNLDDKKRVHKGKATYPCFTPFFGVDEHICIPALMYTQAIDILFYVNRKLRLQLSFMLSYISILGKSFYISSLEEYVESQMEMTIQLILSITIRNILIKRKNKKPYTEFHQGPIKP